MAPFAQQKTPLRGTELVLGAKATGILAVFPIVLTSLILILHPRIGGPATATVLANTSPGLVGFSLCCLTAYLLVERIGSAAGLCPRSLCR